ncbi:hypothetical protein [Janibacter cremeus]|uniref:Uncharacterized protein n=1 Tax=Janibacter cremeus TaxID=1285192 RepID=A0A852VRN3_9MICO|nr:hypothetical protein [Janibacter cremeus]NYF99667.1 hypothetical protein [Janibacter cremeus]
MHELPASVRVALWSTHAWAADTGVPGALARALPDVGQTQDLQEQLRLWRDLGEAAVLVALPGPGHTAGLPRCGPVATQAAVEAGEALFVPGLGGMLVPEHSSYGSAGATAHRIDWVAHDCDPVPVHRIEALDHSQLERHLRRRLLAAVDDLEDIGGRPWSSDLAHDLVDDRLGADWALPPQLPDRARRVIGMAATLSVAATVGLENSGTLSAAHEHTRASALRALHRDAEEALAEATNAACATLAGWVPAR